MKTLKIGLAGIGRIGKIHLHNLARNIQEVEVAGVMDILNESEQIAGEYEIPVFTKDYDQLLAVPDLDAVLICSPTDTHADYCIKAARAGKAIFCEKPIDLSLDRVQKVLEAVKGNGVKMMVGFNRRFDNEFMKIRQLVTENAIGDPQIIKITSRDPGPPPLSYIKVSGGMFLDMTIHDFDMARFISGKRVKEVFARGAVLVDPSIGAEGDIDTAVVTITFDDNSLAVIDNSRKAVYGYDQRLEVFGDKGMALADNNFKDNHRYYNEKGISGSLPLDFFMDRYKESYLLEMKAFIKALQHDEDVPVGGDDGLISLAIGTAAKKSMKENRSVKLEEIIRV